MSLVNNRMFIVFCYQIAKWSWRFGIAENPNDRFDVSCKLDCCQGAEPLTDWANSVEQRHMHILCTQCLLHTSVFNLFYISMIFLCGFPRTVSVHVRSHKIWGLINSFVLHFVDHCPLHTFLPEKRAGLFGEPWVSALPCIVIIVGWRLRISQNNDRSIV